MNECLNPAVVDGTAGLDAMKHALYKAALRVRAHLVLLCSQQWPSWIIAAVLVQAVIVILERPVRRHSISEQLELVKCLKP